jgi:amidophosphoribosyltransferase
VGKDGVVASETCALEKIGAAYTRDVEPGEIVLLRPDQPPEITRWLDKSEIEEMIDIFEFFYFSLPISKLIGARVSVARRNLGRRLANTFMEVHPEVLRRPDLVVLPVPDSANDAGIGFHERLREMGVQVKFDQGGIFRPHGKHLPKRSFLQRNQADRLKTLDDKFNIQPEFVAGKRILLVDDSLVRGNTMRKLVRRLLAAGALEVHICIASPPYRFPCIYGIDTYRPGDKLAFCQTGGNLRRLARLLGAKTVTYLLLDECIAAIRDAGADPRYKFYHGPFSGVYPDGIGDMDMEIWGLDNTALPDEREAIMVYEQVARD